MPGGGGCGQKSRGHDARSAHASARLGRGHVSPARVAHREFSGTVAPFDASLLETIAYRQALI